MWDAIEILSILNNHIVSVSDFQVFAFRVLELFNEVRVVV